MSRRETAVRLFKEGYSCSQAVLLAFSDRIGISEEQAALVSSSFGAGIGKLRETCGAVSGMLMATQNRGILPRKRRITNLCRSW